MAEYAGASPPASPTKEYVYGASGLLATVDSSGVKYITPDHLGSTRVVTDGANAVTSRHDYFPFGEEIGALNRPAPGYGQAGPRQKFTSKERDVETGLDYFGARYFASSQGRVASADNFLKDTHVGQPASWNLYVYARDNPLYFVDPTGEAVFQGNLNAEQQQLLIADLKATTGFKDVQFVKGELTVNVAAGFSGGSAAARVQLLDAIGSADHFNLKAVDTTDVSFGEVVDEARVTYSTGKTYTRYTVQIDFGDFKRTSGHDEAKQAWSVSIVTLHELGHKVYNLRDTPHSNTDPGPLEREKINPIRRELGLPERVMYESKAVPAHLKTMFPNGGNQQVFRLNDKEYFLRWRRDNVGGAVK
ncbi:MAG: RHS repeat-associated core domain-containing protein [Acidobacteria bacterium]|nr:RHS repeat-associated core domain-containing protein [Acidobacteriota bacterium]